MLIDRCTIRRKTNASGATTGAPTTTWSDASTGVRCAVQCEGSSESFSNDRESPQRDFTVYLPYGTSLVGGDRIKPTTGQYTNLMLEVVGAPEDRAGRRHHIHVPCRRVEGETG